MTAIIWTNGSLFPETQLIRVRENAVHVGRWHCCTLNPKREVCGYGSMLGRLVRVFKSNSPKWCNLGIDDRAPGGLVQTMTNEFLPTDKIGTDTWSIGDLGPELSDICWGSCTAKCLVSGKLFSFWKPHPADNILLWNCDKQGRISWWCTSDRILGRNSPSSFKLCNSKRPMYSGTVPEVKSRLETNIDVLSWPGTLKTGWLTH